MTWFHPVFALLAVVATAVQTHVIVLRRIWLTWKWFSNGKKHINQRIRGIIFDLDGTEPDSMPVLTKTAVRLMTEITRSQGRLLRKDIWKTEEWILQARSS